MGDRDDDGAVVHLHLRHAEAISGWAQLGEAGERRPFDGWLELMVVLDALRGATKAPAAAE